MFTSTKLHFSDSYLCAKSIFAIYLYLQQKGPDTALHYVLPVSPHYYTPTRLYIHTPLLHCDIPGMPITPIATSQCNHVAKTNAFARISLHVPLSLLSFPISRITIFLPYSRSFFLSSRVSPIQWRMKAFREKP